MLSKINQMITLIYESVLRKKERVFFQYIYRMAIHLIPLLVSGQCICYDIITELYLV